MPGLYANASEVMRAALRLLERDEREHEEKMVALRAAIDRRHREWIRRARGFLRVRREIRIAQKEA